ncbi:Xaa-pro aminopeptidase [Rubidibacter lacunae KORDI 51-2]|uniref:Xaa-Pro aminopeptidase n=1 Tax=Rubidibacter lacunae KORDI 51-2 TaxID=582515 RepID=U5DRS7_9CHRO|nr:aminopeptidase P N-terminal domain-containing protein [Rubidibacter lacunae]ERN42395.1 Xaa-pro aminopeptidase [Rubidibacter lacunae KORDI 51-2]
MTIAPAEYRQRREALLEKIGGGTALFRSAPMAVMHNDVEYSFRQDSDFYYLTGFDEPSAVAVFTPHHEEHQFVLFVQPKDPEKETWVGLRAGVDAAKERYGADIAYSIDELDEKLPQYIEKADRIYHRMGRDRAFDTKVIAHWQRQLAKYQKEGRGPIALEDPRAIFHPLRMVKSPAELALMRRAAEIAVDAHARAFEVTRPGCYEYEIQAELEYVFRKRGALGPAYPSIVASGVNACILHYIENSRQMQDSDLLLIDAGCSYDYYNSDITRTFPVGGRFTTEQKLLYELVLEAQQQAIAEVKPGNPYNAFHDKAVRVLVEGFVELGILKGNVDQLIEEEKYKPYYMHRTGHWLGVDVHDVGAYKLGDDRWQPLQPGHVLTVEPGIYIAPDVKPAEDQPEVDDRWRGIGIRIEDDVLVTAAGQEVLTAALPKSVEDMERRNVAWVQ